MPHATTFKLCEDEAGWGLTGVASSDSVDGGTRSKSFWKIPLRSILNLCLR